MKDLGDNAYECEKDETITMTFRPTEPKEVSVEATEDKNVPPKPVEDLTWIRKIGDKQVNLHVIYKFFPGSTSRCKIFLKGDKGGPTVEDRPPAEDAPRTPEHRIYSFIPKKDN